MNSDCFLPSDVETEHDSDINAELPPDVGSVEELMESGSGGEATTLRANQCSYNRCTLPPSLPTVEEEDVDMLPDEWHTDDLGYDSDDLEELNNFDDDMDMEFVCWDKHGPPTPMSSHCGLPPRPDEAKQLEAPQGFAEYYSPPRVAPQARAMGVVADLSLDLETEWDFRLPELRKLSLDLLRMLSLLVSRTNSGSRESMAYIGLLSSVFLQQ